LGNNKCPHPSADVNIDIADWIYNENARFDLRNILLLFDIVNETLIFSQAVKWGIVMFSNCLF